MNFYRFEQLRYHVVLDYYSDYSNPKIFEWLKCIYFQVTKNIEQYETVKRSLNKILCKQRKLKCGEWKTGDIDESPIFTRKKSASL